MKLKKISILKVEIPMNTSFTTSFGTVTKKPTIIVRIETENGIIGYGESAAMPFPFYKPETADTCMLVLKKYIIPLVLQEEFDSIEVLMNILKVIKGHNFAKTGLETAVWMAISLEKNTSLAKLLGGTQEKVAVGESIGIKESIEETLEEIDFRIKQGFQRIKIKIKPGWDIQVVKSIRDRFPQIPLMVDANSSYFLADIKTLQQFDDYNLMMDEQPLADDDIVDHAVLAKKTKTPICLDESIHSVEDARRAFSIHACAIINIKPGRVGGLLESKKIHDLAEKNNISVWCGGMLETGIGRAFNIAIASLPNYKYPADMSPVKFFYKDDLVKNSFEVDKNGFVTVPTTPGLGYDIDEQKIKKYTTEKIEFSR
jgi:O-succinylbenzoate synthase